MGGNPGGEQVVLKLLVDGYHHEDPQAVCRVTQQSDDQGKGPGDVGTDHGNELGHDAHPEGQGQRGRQANQLEGRPVDERGAQGQEATREYVAACLLYGQVPDLQHVALVSLGQERADQAA